jgi:PAS domain S-box-containing protein/putative nucleotidyltransferase with HDIG domain
MTKEHDPPIRPCEAILLESLKNTYFVYSCTKEGQITYISPSIAKVLGYTEDEFIELINNPQSDILNGEYILPSHETLKNGRTIPYEMLIPCKDGSPCWLEVSEVPIRDENGDTTAIECIFHNISERKKAELGLQASVEKLRKALAGTIQAMALTVETRDAYTAGHQRRVTNLARSIAQEMGMNENDVDGLRMAGVIHDLGKISVPGEILNKPGKLTNLEFDLIKIHPQTGFDILKNIDFQWPIAQIVLQHHERLDGSGYPHGLRGEDILQEAKILAVSDVVEAMSSHRPYRATLGIDMALEEITKNKNLLYDADIVDTAVDLFTNKDFQFNFTIK